MLENYHRDEFGVIHQTEFEPIQYDHEYLTYYEKLSDRTIKLDYQRMGWLLGYRQISGFPPPCTCARWAK